MDDWTYAHADADVPDTQPPLLFEHGGAMGRARAQQAGTARVTELEQTQALDAVGNPVGADVPLPFATPPSIALTF